MSAGEDEQGGNGKPAIPNGQVVVPKQSSVGLRPSGTLPGLAAALQGTGYTLKKLADEADVSEQSVRRALKAERPSSSATLERVVNAANELFLKAAPFSLRDNFRPNE